MKHCLPASRRGVVLIVVLGVLVVLALLATTFAAIQRLEREVSRNYLDDVRAKLLAQSGVEFGASRLRQMFEKDLFVSNNDQKAWKYFGNDLLEMGNNAALLNVPLEKAQNPSFAYENETIQNPTDAVVTPKTLVVEGQTVGFSGMMDSGTYGKNSDHYSLRITDLQGLIHVNDGLPWGPNGSVSQNLKRILNTLGQVVGVPNLGTMILNNRPAAGYMVKQELLRAVNYDPVAFNKFKDFVTVAAWTDKNVANPVPFSGSMLPQYPVTYYRGTGVYRYGKGKDSGGNLLPGQLVFAPPANPNSMSHAYYAYDELNPQYVEIVARSPVNINAAPKEVLISLLTGLKGCFSVERRRNNPRAWSTVYAWLPTKHTYSPAGTDGDEVGYLYTTVDIIYSTGTGTGGGISAATLADEMIACRNKNATPFFNYATVPWGGPFKTWRQFYQFCDNLVATGVLVDNRNIYFDFNPATMDITGGGGLIPSAIQKKVAAKALADLLKANFNPNLHLNELNVDQNMHLLIDKTDLVANSTEFCFTPMGLFEIQSLGRVLSPVGADDSLLASNNRIHAVKKITAIVKLFDAYRETHQKQFMAGTFADRTGPPETNNNYSIEVGPEPDNGLAPSENEWDGYIGLPTVGGTIHQMGQHKPVNALVSTPAGPVVSGSALHGHFTWDFNLHHHVDGIRDEVARKSLPNEQTVNFPDKTEGYPGPYDPVLGTPNRHRLCRSFRLPTGGASATMPALTSIAPSDLRIDGGFTERHSGIAYWLSNNIIGSQIGQSQGLASYWIKPNWQPEMSGKPKNFLNMDRYHGGVTSYVQPSPFVHMYVASHDAPSFSMSSTELATPTYTWNPFGVNPMRNSSFAFGFGFSGYSGYGSGTIAEGGFCTPTLNHLSHPDAMVKPSPLQGHKWIHVILQWDVQNQYNTKIYVNGQIIPGSNPAWYWTYAPNGTLSWATHENGKQNTLRFGAVSRFIDMYPLYQRNWSSDSTVDELYAWNSTGPLMSAIGLWQAGRYYKPMDPNYEGIFISQELSLAVGSGRYLPPPSSAAPPVSTGAPAPPGPTSTSVPLPATLPKVRLIGASWTWMAEGVDATQQEILKNYLPGPDLHPQVEFTVLVDGVTYPVVNNPAYSPLRDTAGGPITVTTTFKYRFQIKIPDAEIDSILLATPYIDDVTIYYEDGGPLFVSYYLE